MAYEPNPVKQESNYTDPITGQQFYDNDPLTGQVRKHSVQKPNFNDISKYTVTGKMLWNRKVEVIPHLVEGLIPQIGLIIIGGTGGIGKSAFCRQLAAAIALGEPDFLGYPLRPSSRKAIYVSTEDGEIATANLIRKQNPSPSNLDDLDNLYFIHEPDKILNKLEECCRQLRPSLIVIDCLADIAGGELDFNSTNRIRAELEKYNNLAKKYETAIVFIHHVSKAAEKNSPGKNNLLGSVSFSDKARLVLEFRADSNDSSKVNVSIVKTNYLPPEAKDLITVYEFRDMLYYRTGIFRSRHGLSTNKNIDHQSLINNLLAKKPGASSRKIADILSHQGYPIGKTKVAELMKNCPLSEPVGNSVDGQLE